MNTPQAWEKGTKAWIHCRRFLCCCPHDVRCETDENFFPCCFSSQFLFLISRATAQHAGSTVLLVEVPVGRRLCGKSIGRAPRGLWVWVLFSWVPRRQLHSAKGAMLRWTVPGRPNSTLIACSQLMMRMLDHLIPSDRAPPTDRPLELIRSHCSIPRREHNFEAAKLLKLNVSLQCKIGLWSYAFNMICMERNYDFCMLIYWEFVQKEKCMLYEEIVRLHVLHICIMYAFLFGVQTTINIILWMWHRKYVLKKFILLFRSIFISKSFFLFTKICYWFEELGEIIRGFGRIFWREYYAHAKAIDVELQISFWPIQPCSKITRILLEDHCKIAQRTKFPNSALNRRCPSKIVILCLIDAVW